MLRYKKIMSAEHLFFAMLIICIKSKINHAKIKTKKVCLFAVLIFIFNVFIFPLQMLHIAQKKRTRKTKGSLLSLATRTPNTHKRTAPAVYINAGNVPLIGGRKHS